MKFLLLGLIFLSTCSVFAFTSNTLKTNSRNIQCAPANSSSSGSMSSSDFGKTFGACDGFGCLPSYTKVGSSCNLTVQSRTCTSQPSNSTGGLETSTNGGVSYGSCTGFTCNSGYVVSGGSCVSGSPANVVCNTVYGSCIAGTSVNSYSIGSSVSFSMDFLGCAHNVFTVTSRWNCSASYITTNFPNPAAWGSSCSPYTISMGFFTSNPACTPVP